MKIGVFCKKKLQNGFFEKIVGFVKISVFCKIGVFCENQKVFAKSDFC
jgi:hypothetical protein